MKKVTRYFAGVLTAVLLSVLLLQFDQEKPKVQAAITFPAFTFDSTLIDNDDDLIFPSVIKASDYFSNPLGTYYLYTGPHDSDPTNGYDDILLYYSNSITGPWTLYTDELGNPKPVITGALTKANHTASPHAIWMEEYNKLFVYVHAANPTTRWVESTDGINFTYGGVAVTDDQFASLVPFVPESAAYSRVYKYTIPSLGNKYVLTTSIADGGADNAKHIGMAVSNDGKNWTVVNRLLLSGDANYQILDASYLPYGGKHYFVYSKRSRINPNEPINMYISEVSAEWNQQTDETLFYQASPSYPDSGVARGATFITIGNYLYMPYEAGQKHHAQIALAKAYIGGGSTPTPTPTPTSTPSPTPSATPTPTPSGSPVRYEFENLTVSASSGDTQEIINRSAASGGKLFKYNSNAVGDYVTFTVNIPSAGTYNVNYRYESGSQLGIVQLLIDGTTQGPTVDLLGDGSLVTGNLGNVTFSTPGNKTFRYEVTGKNPSSPNYYFKLDYIELTPQ